MQYTIGAMFTEDLKKVLLIKKQKPDWQKGKYNFPGGKVENVKIREKNQRESYKACIVREFKEETSMKTMEVDWHAIGSIEGEGYSVELLVAVFLNSMGMAITITDEEVEWFNVDNLPKNIIDNLLWLIPFCVNFLEKDPTTGLETLQYGIFKYA